MFENYNGTPLDLALKNSEKVYRIAKIIQDYCNYQETIEEIAALLPIIEELKDSCDTLWLILKGIAEEKDPNDF